MKNCSCNMVRNAALSIAAILVWNGLAGAQSTTELSETQLRQPWEQHVAVLNGLSDPIGALTDAQARTKLADNLSTLHTALVDYERQVDTVIDRIIGDPQFGYEAATTSKALSARLAVVHTQFEALYTSLVIHEREDVRAAQASLAALQAILQETSAFERDVLSALGSLSRQTIVGLATRWWNGEERAIAVKKRVADLRQQLGEVSPDAVQR